MDNGTTVYVDNIITALEMSNKQFMEDVLKAFDEKIENCLGCILTISNDFFEFEILHAFDGIRSQYTKQGVEITALRTGGDYILKSCKPVSYSFDIKDDKIVIKNLGFDTEPKELNIGSITIEGDTYHIMKKCDTENKLG
jgi:hypothetical protein|nr:MAG TPA: hypothetical protein [Caudoviricetes sp.]